VTIYPRDQASGKSFMCIIMLDAEPERLQLLPTDSSRVRTVDISVEQEWEPPCLDRTKIETAQDTLRIFLRFTGRESDRFFRV